MPDISIIVPIYNAENYLDKCIESLLNQTKKEIEIILINDGSTDNSEKIIKSYKDKRIKYFKNENQGIGKTRNFGIEKAKGKYLMFVDSDDYIDKNMAKLMFDKAFSNSLDMVVCDYYKVINNENIEEKLPSFKPTTLKNSPNLLYDINLSPWNKIYKTSLVKDNNIRFVEDLKYEDAPFVIETLDKANKIGKVNKCLNYYVIHGNSETTVRDKRVFDILKIVDKIRKYFKGKDYIKESLDKLTVRIITNYTIQQRVQKDKKIGMQFIEESFKYLKQEVPDYKNNKYYENRGVLRKVIEKNKILTKIYCRLYKKDNADKKDNIKKFLREMFIIVFGVLFTYILINATIFNKYKDINPIVIIISSIIYIFVCYLLSRLLSKIKNTSLYLSVVMITYVIIQLIFAYIFVVEPSWDFGTVYQSAVNNVIGNATINSNSYFYVHPNNIGITIFLSFFYKIFYFFHITNWNFLGILLNIICIDIGIIYTYKLLYLYYKPEKCNLFLILILSFTPFLTYVPIFYTDTMSLPFGIAGLYYYLCYEKQSGKDKKYKLFISGLLLGIGYFIKSTVIIIFIAIIVYNFFKEEQESFVNNLKKIFMIFIGVFIPFMALQIYININFDNKVLNELKFPGTHYLMMGLKNSGEYNAEDQFFTGSFKGIENKKKANLEIIEERLNKMSEKHELLEFYTNKLIYTWGDGTFFAPYKLERLPKKDYEVKNLILFNKDNSNVVYQIVAQSQLIIILLFISLGCIFRKYLTTDERNLQLVVNISIIGILILLLLWETRSRYLMNFTPLLLVSTFVGLNATIRYLKKRKEKIHEERT